MQTTKYNVKIGMNIWWAIDDRPIERPMITKGVVTEIYDDHFLFDTDLCPGCWGEYDEDLSQSCVTFITEQTAKDWLRKKGAKL